MRKTLGKINKSDLQEIRELSCNYQTFKTLKLIYSAMNPSKVSDIQKKAEETKANIEQFQLNMYEKYGVPIYISNNMYIDTANGEIFIDV